jgi:hypothetical protein
MFMTNNPLGAIKEMVGPSYHVRNKHTHISYIYNIIYLNIYTWLKHVKTKHGVGMTFLVLFGFTVQICYSHSEIHVVRLGTYLGLSKENIIILS